MSQPTTVSYPSRAALSNCLQIATFNTSGLFNARAQSQRKLELLLEYCIIKDIAVIMCQETFEPTSPDLPHLTRAELDYPSAWVVLSVPNTTITNRRGQLILGNKAILQRYGLELRYVTHCSDDPDIEFLAATLGPWHIVSVYLTSPEKLKLTTCISRLSDKLASFRGLNSRPLIMGGDFNYSKQTAQLHSQLAERFGVEPLLRTGSGFITHPPNCPKNRGTLIDNIFSNRSLSAQLASPPGPCFFEQAPPAPPARVNSDHYPITAAFPPPWAPHPGSGPAPRVRAHQHVAAQISWRKLEQWRQALTSPALKSSDPIRAEKAQQAAEKATKHLAEVTSQLEALDPAGLDEANTAFLKIAENTFGTYRPRPGVRHPYMCHPEVRMALKGLRKAHKRYLAVRSIYRREPTEARAAKLQEASQLHREARQEWELRRDSAIQTTHEDLLAQAARGPGLSKDFFNHYRRARGVKKANGRDLPFLDPDKAREFWQGIFRRHPDAPDVAEWDPLVPPEDLPVITPAQVEATLKHMSRKCAGPDGLDFLFLQAFSPTVSPTLARCFNEIIRHGLPADSPLRVSETLLFYKLSTPHQASDPSKYRPITLLPMVIRVLHKLLDLLFRGPPEDDEEDGKGAAASTPGQGERADKTRRPQSSAQPPPQASAEQEEEPPAPPDPIFPPKPPWSFHKVQAGFEPRRSTLEPAFLLHLLQSADQRGFNPPTRYAALLDLKKAYDMMDYSVILEHLRTLSDFPLAYVEILRWLLPGNFTKVMGHKVPFERGLPQGGALCPFLCQACVNSLAEMLYQLFQEHGELTIGSTWIHSPAWWLPEGVDEYYLDNMLYADDITLVAPSIPALKLILECAVRWATQAFMEINPDKSFCVQLSGPILPPESPAPAPLQVDGPQPLTLQWHKAEEHPTFRYLGFPTSTHRTPPGYISFNSTALNLNLKAFYAMWMVRPNQRYVVLPALRFAIEQVLYASSLYQCALTDTNYTKLGSQTLQAVRSALGLPYQLYTAYVRWELRLQPPELRGHYRAIHAAVYLWHYSWIGRELLQPLWRGRRYLGSTPSGEPQWEQTRTNPPTSGPYSPSHPVFAAGPLQRYSKIIAHYFPEEVKRHGHPLTWLHRGTGQHQWKHRSRFTEGLKQRVNEHFYKEMRDELLKKNHLHPTICQVHLAEMPVPIGDLKIPFEVPMYQLVKDDLPRAGIQFRAPWLGHVFQADLSKHGGRPACAWCKEPNAEWGYHLLRCSKTPPPLPVQRQQVLEAIHQDLNPASNSNPDPTSPCNLDRLYRLTWEGATAGERSRKKFRSDKGEQPAELPLRMALWYMRSCINAYSPVSGLRPPTTKKAKNQTAKRDPDAPRAQRIVPSLPVYGKDPFKQYQENGHRITRPLPQAAPHPTPSAPAQAGGGPARTGP